jgi:hypothetical protein
MKKFLLVSTILLLIRVSASGQSLISINPDSALQGQYVTTTVTASGFFFTMGSGPMTGGNFYMTNLTTNLYPDWISILGDNLFEATWSIPLNQAPGNYTVRYEHYDQWNPWGWPTIYDVPGGFTIVGCPGPAAAITAQSATTFCSGGSVILNANTGAGLSWQWLKNGINITGANSSSYTATASGNYSVRVYNTAGCYAVSNTIVVSVQGLPNSSIWYQVPASFCQGTGKSLYGYIQTNVSYQWILNGVDIPGATSHSYNATAGGNYTLRTVNAAGCTTTTAVPTVITMISAPPATITPSGPTTFCAGTGVTLSANSGTGYAYQWFKYGNVIPGATNQTLTVTNSAKYKVQVTNSSGCTKKSATVTTTSIPLPTAQITAQGPTTFCAGDSVRLTANTGTGLTYQWKKYANPIAGATSSGYTAKNAGKYKVVVTNATGCSRTSNAIVVTVPCRMQGVELPEGELFVFDDPSRRKLFVEGNWSGPVEMISVDGKSILAVPNYTSDGIDLTGIPSGMYVAIIRTEREVITHKFFYSR